MLGIPDYQPIFFQDAKAFRTAHVDRLQPLVGTRIDNAWSMWSGTNNEWFPDGPVILRVRGPDLELSAFQLGFGITWNAIDRSRPLRWFVQTDEDDGFGLCWKEQAPAPLLAAVGKVINAVELIEGDSDLGGSHAWLLCGIGFRLAGGYLAVFNALDELGLSSEPMTAKGFRSSDLG